MRRRSLPGVSILVVEDDPDGRYLLETLFEIAGATVRIAATAEEGLEKFKAGVPAIVLTDIVLPGHDGVWLLRQIRDLPGAAGVPVVAYTGRVFPADTKRFRDAGFDGHLVKPIDFDELADAIAALTRHR